MSDAHGQVRITHDHEQVRFLHQPFNCLSDVAKTGMLLLFSLYIGRASLCRVRLPYLASVCMSFLD